MHYGHALKFGTFISPRTLARLRQLKRRYDPDNVFRDNFNIARTSGN